MPTARGTRSCNVQRDPDAPRLCDGDRGHAIKGISKIPIVALAEYREVNGNPDSYREKLRNTDSGIEDDYQNLSSINLFPTRASLTIIRQGVSDPNNLSLARECSMIHDIIPSMFVTFFLNSKIFLHDWSGIYRGKYRLLYFHRRCIQACGSTGHFTLHRIAQSRRFRKPSLLFNCSDGFTG